MKNNTLQIYREKTIKEVEAKIKLLGPNTSWSPNLFLTIRLCLCLIIFLFFIITSKIGYVLAIVISISFYLLFEYLVFNIPIKKRRERLEKEALFFFEIFLLSIESGRSLKRALELTVENIDSELSQEFKRTLTEVKLGKSLNEALESMKQRIPSETINNTILNIIQANTYGTNIIESMYNQINFLRDKQILDVKAKIAKLPTKVSIISVIFFIPIMLLIILAPVLINYIIK